MSAAEPWLDEPDQLAFVDETTGYPCLMRRNPFGAWCAYVGVPADHPWFGKSYHDQVPVADSFWHRTADMDRLGVFPVIFAGKDSNRSEGLATIDMIVRCHGGLTFAGDLSDIDPRSNWWFGFDCGHHSDLQPKLQAMRPDLEKKFPALRELRELADDALKGDDWKNDGVPHSERLIYRDVTYVKAALECACVDIAQAAVILPD